MGETMNAITFVKNQQTSIVTTKEDLLKEINHYKTFWISGIGSEYSNQERTVKIKVHGLDNELRQYLANRMKG